jgi:hypothetical protein
MYAGCVGTYLTAAALANTVTKEDLARKQLYPALPGIRDISAQVAAAVADVAYEKGKLINAPITLQLTASKPL